MLPQSGGQLFGNALPGAELLLDVGQLSPSLLQQELPHGEVQGGVDVEEKKSSEGQDYEAIFFDDQSTERDKDLALLRQKEAQSHEENRGSEETLVTIRCSY